MANNASKRAINTFSGGMDMDIDKSLLKSNQYRYAENIRTVSNDTAVSGSATNIEGSSLIKSPLNTDTFFDGEEIIGVSTMRDYAVVFTHVNGTSSPRLNKIYRIKFNSDNTVDSCINILNPSGIDLNIPEGAVLSIVTRYEDSNTMKVYWADGYNPIKVINISESLDSENQSISSYEQLDIVPSADLKSPEIMSISNSGNLKAGIIRYFFQAVNTSGSSSPLSPISNPIQLTSSNIGVIGDKSISYLGSGIDATTSKGKNVNKSVRLKIDVTDISGYDKIRIISAYCFNYNEQPDLNVIYSTKISNAVEVSGRKYIYFIDNGTSVLQELTTEELNAIAANIFVPQYIDTKNNMLFAANIKEIDKDESIDPYDVRAYQFNSNGKVKINSIGQLWSSAEEYNLEDLVDIPKEHDCIHTEIYEKDRYSDLECVYDSSGIKFGGEGPNVSYCYVNTYFIESYGNYWNKGIDSNGELLSITDKYKDIRTPRIGDKNRNISNLKYKTSTGVNGFINLSSFHVPSHVGPLNYANPYLSNKFSSYQRDEIYRFAAVFYDKKGKKSSANWIADIRFPAGYMKSLSWDANIFESPDENIVSLDGGGELDQAELLIKPLGIQFTFNNIPSSIKKIEIVRAKRDINNKTIYGQGVIQKVGTYNNPKEQHESSANIGNGDHNTAADGAEETDFQYLDNTLLPHPIIAMGYQYSQLGPHFERSRYDSIPQISPSNANRQRDRLVMSFGSPSDYYDGYGTGGSDDGGDLGAGAAALGPGIIEDAGFDNGNGIFACRYFSVPYNYSMVSTNASHAYPFRFDFTKHKLSPIFSNKDYFLFVNPETTYYGADYVELLIPNMSNPKLDIVDIIHPMSAPLSYPLSTSASSYWGPAEYNRFHIKGSNGEVVPTGMSFGADINDRNYNNSVYLSTFGVIGMHQKNCSNGVGAYTGLNEGLDLVYGGNYGSLQNFLDIRLESDSDTDYNGTKNVYIALGGLVAWGSRYYDGLMWRSSYEYRNGVGEAGIFPTLPDCDYLQGPHFLPYSSTSVLEDQSNIDAGVGGGSFKYFCSVNDYDSSQYGREFDFIYQTGVGVSNVNKVHLKASNIRSNSSLNPSNTILTFNVDSFRYSKDIKPGVRFRDASSDLVSIGSRNFLNWSKPLTYGDYSNGSDQVASNTGKANNAVSFAATKTQGIHGDGIIVNMKSGNSIPSIANYNSNRKKYDSNLSSYGQYNDSKYKYLDNNGAAALSTYVMNLKEMSSSIYGGNSYSDRQFSEYISTGCVINVNENPLSPLDNSTMVFEGDTFIGIFDYTVVRANDNKETGKDVALDNLITGGMLSQSAIRRQQKHVGALLPLESSINMHLVNSKSYIANGYNPCIQKELGSYSVMSNRTSITYTQTLNQYEYNSAYSSQNTALSYTQRLIEENKNRVFDCRVLFSNVKTNGELIDNWSIFNVSDYTDLNSEYGQITQIRKFGERMFFWQRDAFGYLPINEKSVIQDGNLSSLTLGTGGVLKTPAEYITTSNGFAFGVIGGIVSSIEAMYWYDHLRAEVCSFSGGINLFSKTKGIQSILNKSKDSITNSIPMVYDRKYNEIMLTLTGLVSPQINN